MALSHGFDLFYRIRKPDEPNHIAFRINSQVPVFNLERINMTLMPRPVIKKTIRTVRDGFPSAWDVIHQASVAPIETLCSESHKKQIIKLILPTKDVCIRNLTRECPHAIIYGLASAKNSRTVEAQSFNEFNMAHILEAHPCVTSYTEQPFIITWIDKAGIHHKHIPDFSVSLKKGIKLVVEVKPDSALNNYEITERTQFISKYLPISHSMIYLLVVTSQIEGQEVENARIVNGYHPVNVSEVETLQIREMLKKLNYQSCLKLIDTSEEDSSIKNLGIKIRSLIRKGVVSLDFKKPFTDLSPLYWGACHE